MKTCENLIGAIAFFFFFAELKYKLSNVNLSDSLLNSKVTSELLSLG